MALDLPPPPVLWTPPKPAIIRASELPKTYAEAKRIALKEATFPFPIMSPGGAWYDALAPLTMASLGGSATWTYRNVVPSSLLGAISSSRVRLTVRGAATGVINAYFGRRAASGDAYDFASSPAPVQCLSGGSATINLAASTDLVLDELNFAFDPAFPHMFAAYVVSGTNPMALTTAGGGLDQYFKNANDASTVNATGYTTNTSNFAGLRRIEVFA